MLNNIMAALLSAGGGCGSEEHFAQSVGEAPLLPAHQPPHRIRILSRIHHAHSPHLRNRSHHYYMLSPPIGKVRLQTSGTCEGCQFPAPPRTRQIKQAPINLGHDAQYM